MSLIKDVSLGSEQALPAGIGVLLLGAIGYFCFQLTLPQIEREVRRQANASIENLDQDIKIDVDGRDVYVQGVVDKPHEREALLEAAKQLPGVHNVHESIHTLPKAQVRTLPWIRITAEAQQLLVEGAFGNEGESGLLLAILREVHPELPLINQIQHAVEIEAAAWLAPLAQLLYQEKQLARRGFTLRHNRLHVSPDGDALPPQSKLQQWDELFMGVVSVERFFQPPITPPPQSALSVGTEIADQNMPIPPSSNNAE